MVTQAGMQKPACRLHGCSSTTNIRGMHVSGCAPFRILIRQSVSYLDSVVRTQVHEKPLDLHVWLHAGVTERRARSGHFTERIDRCVMHAHKQHGGLASRSSSWKHAAEAAPQGGISKTTLAPFHAGLEPGRKVSEGSKQRQYCTPCCRKLITHFSFLYQLCEKEIVLIYVSSCVELWSLA